MIKTYLAAYKSAAAALGLSEESYFALEVLKYAGGGASTVIDAVRAAANAAGDAAAVAEIDAVKLGGTAVQTAGSTASAALPAASFTDAAVTSKLLTGFVSGAGALAASDTILQGVNKLDGNVGAVSTVASAALPAAKLVAYLSAATAGGTGVTETLVVTGLEATDTILAVSPQVVGATATAALTAYGAPGAGSLSVTYTVDPGAGAKVLVLVKKA